MKLITQCHCGEQPNIRHLKGWSRAARRYAELHDKVVGDFLGPILRFKIWHPADEFGYDVADHHGYISIQELPLHLWKKDAEEQILHPYCAVIEAVDHTKTRSDLPMHALVGVSRELQFQRSSL